MASNVLLGYANLFKTGSITAGSSASGLGAGNLTSDVCAPSTGWQTLAGVVTSGGGATLTVTSPTPGIGWRAFGLFRTNITSGATVTVTLFSNPGPSTVFTAIVAGPQTGYGQIVVATSAVVNGDYVTFQINDPVNPDGHINVGGAFAGPAWNPLSGITWDTTYGATTQQIKVISRGGQEYRNQLYRQRYWKIAMDAVANSEAWDDLGELDRIGSLGGNVLLVPDITSVDISREAVFGTLDPQADVNFQAHSINARAWRAQITERL